MPGSKRCALALCHQPFQAMLATKPTGSYSDSHVLSDAALLNFSGGVFQPAQAWGSLKPPGTPFWKKPSGSYFLLTACSLATLSGP